MPGPRRQILREVARGATLRARQAHRKTGVAVRAGQHGEAAGRTGILDQEPSAVIGVLGCDAAGICLRRQQPVGGIGQLRRLAGGVRDRREVTVRLDGERGALAAGSHDRRGMSLAVPLDRRHLPGHIRHGREDA